MDNLKAIGESILFKRRCNNETAMIDVSMEDINMDKIREHIEDNANIPKRIREDVLIALLTLEKYCVRENIPIKNFNTLEVYRGLLVLRIRLDITSNVYIHVDVLNYNRLTRSSEGWLSKLISSIW